MYKYADVLYGRPCFKIVRGGCSVKTMIIMTDYNDTTKRVKQ